jgi:hypothetical protein
MADTARKTAKFEINGITTKELYLGEPEFLGDGMSSIKLVDVTSDGRDYYAKFCFKSPTTGTSSPDYYCEGIIDYLKDGATKTYAINGRDYEVTEVFVDKTANSARLSINGMLTSNLWIGDSDVLGDGETKLRIYEIMVNQQSELVTFCLESEPYRVCRDTDPDAEYQEPAWTSFGYLNKQDYCLDNNNIMDLGCKDELIMRDTADHFFTTANKQEIHLQYLNYSPNDRVAIFKNWETGNNIIAHVEADGSLPLDMGGIPLQMEVQNVMVRNSDIEPINFKAILGHEEKCALGCQDNACIVPLEGCHDNDGGKRYEILGTTIGKEGQATDTCHNSRDLDELYCDDRIYEKQRFIIGMANQEHTYLSYRVSDRTVLFKQGDGSNILWDVEPDGSFRVIIGGIEHLFRIQNISEPNSPIISFDELIMIEEVECASGVCSNGACADQGCDIQDSLIDSPYIGVGTKTYSVNNFDYEITLVMLDRVSNTAKFSVNGIITNELSPGESFTQDFKITLKSIGIDGQGNHYALFCFEAETIEPPTPPLACPTGGVTDTLRDGETRTYNINGLEYEITAVFIDSYNHAAKFSVNGVLGSSLQVGNSFNFDGTKITLLELMANQREGMATFCFAGTNEPPTPPVLSCAEGGINDHLRDGETKTYLLQGLKYEITAVFISDGYSAKFSVNGLLTKELGAGDSSNMGSTNIKVLEIMANQREALVNFCFTYTGPVPCNDYDGKNYYVKGSADGMNAQGYYAGYEDACVNSNLLQEYICDNNIVKSESVTCKCINGMCVDNNAPADLTWYPYPFVEQGVMNSKIVIGEQAPTAHVVAGMEIAGGLTGGGTLPVGYAVLDSDVTIPFNMNLISIGLPCVNRVSEALMGYPVDCHQGFTPGKGMIKLFNNNGYVQILVAGYDDVQTRGAALVLKDFNYYALRGTEVQTTTSSDLTTITVNLVPCTDSDGGQDYYAKGSISGAMPSGYISEDRCTTDMNGTLNRLREVVCIDNYGSAVIFDCPYGCNEGACWASHSPCADSDGGQVFGVKGYVTYEGFIDYSTGELIKEWDACVGSILREKYCAAPTSIGLRDYTCPNGCSDGACI